MSVTSDITIQITLIIFGLLAVLFTLLILYTAFHRFILNRRRIRFQKSEEYVLPQIYKFLDGQSTLMDFANAMRHIVDIVVSFKNLNIMIDNLKGEEQVKLRQLLELPQFEKYYLKKLHSRSPIDLQMPVCISKK